MPALRPPHHVWVAGHRPILQERHRRSERGPHLPPPGTGTCPVCFLRSPSSWAPLPREGRRWAWEAQAAGAGLGLLDLGAAWRAFCVWLPHVRLGFQWGFPHRDPSSHFQGHRWVRQARAPHLFCDWLKRSGKEPTQTRQEGRRLALNARDAACSPAPLGWGRGQGPGSWAAHLAESRWDVGHGRSQARESSVRSLSSQALGLGQGGDLLALRGSAGARCGVKQGILGLRRSCQAPSLARPVLG